MATAAIDFEDRSVSIGRIIARTFGVMKRNPLAAFGIALLLSALPQAAIRFLELNLLGVKPSGDVAIGMALLTIAGSLISFLLNALVQGAIVQATLADSEGRSASFGECLAIGLPRILPLVGAGLIVGICSAIGLVLLVFPGFMLFTTWFVASPVVVAEHSGVFASMARSRYLTAGARWKLFGLLLAIAVLGILFSSAWGVAMIATMGMKASVQTGVLSIGLNILLGTLLISFFSIMVTATYVELRNWKDGAPTDALSDIFA